MAALMRAYDGGECCAAINCTNARAHRLKVSFFCFPKDPVRCKIWIENCRRLDLVGQDVTTLHRRGYVFCANHFETSQFMNAKQRNRLIWNAVPTLFDVPNPPPRIDVSKETPSPKHKIIEQSSTSDVILTTLASTKLLTDNSVNINSSLGETSVSSTQGYILHPSILEHDYGFRAYPTVPEKSTDTMSSEIKGGQNNANMIIKKLLEEIMELRKELNRRHPHTIPNDENFQSDESLSNISREIGESAGMENLMIESSGLPEPGQQKNLNFGNENRGNVKIGHVRRLKSSSGHCCSAYLKAEELRSDKLELRKRLRRQYMQILRLKRKSMQPLNNKKQKIEIQNLIDVSEKYLPKTSHQFFATQLKRALVKHPCESRWDQDTKDFSVTLRGISRKAYTHCSKYFELPQRRSVQRWASEIHKTRALMDEQMDSIERVVRNETADSGQVDTIEHGSANYITYYSSVTDSGYPQNVNVTDSCYSQNVSVTTMEPILLFQALTN